MAARLQIQVAHGKFNLALQKDVWRSAKDMSLGSRSDGEELVLVAARWFCLMQVSEANSNRLAPASTRKTPCLV
jgi:hypothetical protein